MKTLNTYIIEKLHLNKDIEMPHYVVIFKYLIRPKCEYKICETPDEVAEEILNYRSFNAVYKIDNLDNLDKLFDSLWEFNGIEQDKEYLKSIGAEQCTDEIRAILKNRNKK